MTKDELLKLVRIYATLSKEHRTDYPTDVIWQENHISNGCYTSIKLEGKIELLEELMNLFEGENNGQ